MRAQEKAAFDAFVRARYPELLRYGRALTGSLEGGSDLVQDALERTLRAWPRLRSRDDPEGYVRRAMVNRHINAIRHRRREQPTADLPERGWTPDEHDRSIWDAIRTLPPRQRTVIALRYFEDLSVAEIADRLGVSEGTVKSQSFKARDHLRTSLSLELPTAVTSEEVPDGQPGQ